MGGVQNTNQALLSTEINETSTNELESNAELEAPADANKTAKAKKPRPKKRARPKLTLETAESVEVKADDEGPTDSASTTCDTPREPSPIKSKKTKVTNKRRKPKVASPTKGKFEFPDVVALEDSFSENSVSPNEIAKEVVAIATRKQQEAQENNRETSSDNDDEVFTSSHDGRDGLSLLATFATAKKPSATKRKRSGTATNSEELSSKKRGRPKKPMDPDSFDLGNVNRLLNAFTSSSHQPKLLNCILRNPRTLTVPRVCTVEELSREWYLCGLFHRLEI